MKSEYMYIKINGLISKFSTEIQAYMFKLKLFKPFICSAGNLFLHVETNTYSVWNWLAKTVFPQTVKINVKPFYFCTFIFLM